MPNQITLSAILDEVYAVIEKAKVLIGGRAIIQECDKSDKLIRLYKDNSFEILMNTQDETLVTMYTYIT